MTFKVKRKKLKEKKGKFSYITFPSKIKAKKYFNQMQSLNSISYNYKLKGNRVYRYKKIEY